MDEKRSSDEMDEDSAARDAEMIAAAREHIAGEDQVLDSPGSGGPWFAGPPADSFAGYRILKEVHRGGQGVVYQAYQESTKREIAIKVLKEGPFSSPADKARFDREVEILGQLHHPNIVAVHDTGVAAGCHFLVMDYVSGQPLDRYIASGEHTIDETLRLFEKICEAVNAAHLRGVIHRDLKPSNIRIDADGEPHILDFGLAKVATPLSPPLEGGDGGGVAAMTLTGQFVGSLPWASPEQAEGVSSKIDVRTDVYSLGVILYQMLTGKFPYDVMGNVRDVLDNIMTAEPVRPGVAAAGRSARAEARGSSTRLAFVASWLRRSVASPIDDEVETIVLKCLAKERERRYQTAGELGRDVRHYLAAEPIEAKRDSLAYVLRKQLKRYKIPAAVAVAFVLVVTVGFVTSLTLWQVADWEAERAKTEAAKSTEVARFTQEMLSGIDPEVAGTLDKRLMRLILDNAAGRIDRELPDQPEVAASLHSTIGSTYRAIGEYDLARPHLEEALRLRTALFGEEQRDTLDSMNDLAAWYYDQDQYDKAEPLLERTLEIRRRVLGEEDPDTLESMNDLAMLLYVARHRYDEAERLLESVLETQRLTLPDEHPDVFRTANNLGSLYYERGDPAKAEPLYRETLKSQREVEGDEHYHTLFTMHNLASVLEPQGKYDEAEELLRATVDARQRVLGANHQLTLSSMCNLAQLYSKCGRKKEAEALFRQVLDTPGHNDHPETIRASQSLGTLLQSQHRYNEAEAELRRSLEVADRVLGDENPITFYCTNNLAWLLLAQRKYAEAEALYRRTVEGRRNLLGEEDLLTISTMCNFGSMYVEWGKYEEAERQFREAVETAEKALPADDARLAAYRSSWGMCLTELGQYERAQDELLASYTVLSESLGEGQEYTRRAIQWLAQLYDAWDAAEPGQGYAEKAAEWRAKLPTTQPTQAPPDP